MPYKNKEDKKNWNINNRDKQKEYVNRFNEKHKEEIEAKRVANRLEVERRRAEKKQATQAANQEAKNKARAAKAERKAQEKEANRAVLLSSPVKLCTLCKQTLDKSCFAKDATRADGYSNKCRECKKVYQISYRDNNKEKIVASDAAYKKKRLEDGKYRDKEDQRRLVTFALRPDVLSRDNYKCVMCESKQSLEVHHIVPINVDISKIADMGNLITLCGACHYKAHNNGVWHTVNEEISRSLVAFLSKGWVPLGDK